MSLFVVVDIGGTQIRAARFDGDHPEPLEVRRIPTRSSRGTAFERMCDLISSVWPEHGRVEAVVVAVPGPLNPETGIVFSAPNIPGWENFPLRDRLAERFQVPIHVGNDANLAALGEWKFGAARGHHHVLYLTISTGIGGGVICDDRLLEGARGLAGELGHITVLPDGPTCGCGQRGHLEALASGPGIARYVLAELGHGAKSVLRPSPDLSAREISEAAGQGDALALAALERAGAYIGLALAGFLHMFNPSIVVFGGGVSFSGDLILAPVKRALTQHIMTPSYRDELTITTAALGDDAGLLGALALALFHHPH